MKFRKSGWLTVLLILAVSLSACNIGATPPAVPASENLSDTDAIQTQAFEIVLTQAAAQQTQTAAALPPTALPTNTSDATATLALAPVAEIPTIAIVEGASPTPFAFNTQQPGLTPIVLVSPTPTLGVINTVTTKNGCNDATYLSETKPFDGDVIDAGKNFSKGWSLSNTGECTWDEGYSFDYLEDYFPDTGISQLPGYDIVLTKNKPEDYTKSGYGNTYVVKLQAPKTPGTYKGYWKMKDDGGNYFGPLVYVVIVVK